MVSTTCRCGTGGAPGVQPLRPVGESLGMTTWAEVPALTREREQVLVRAGIAADAGEAVLEDAAGTELVGALRDDGAPRAGLARAALVVDRLEPMQMI
jgi:hypothetical protein